MKKYNEDNKEKKKQYKENNKEKIKLQNKQYYQKNKEKKKLYNEDHKERKKLYDKQYYQTPEGKKTNKIAQWKCKGLIDSDNDNYETLYNHYLNTKLCDICDVTLTNDRYPTKTRKCMDHDHDTGIFRNILCQSCNVRDNH